ncbi:MAG TPA: hypothetical protein VGI63_07455, partial [Verrucomicrobiae bacterium]
AGLHPPPLGKPTQSWMFSTEQNHFYKARRNPKTRHWMSKIQIWGADGLLPEPDLPWKIIFLLKNFVFLIRKKVFLGLPEIFLPRRTIFLPRKMFLMVWEIVFLVKKIISEVKEIVFLVLKIVFEVTEMIFLPRKIANQTPSGCE